MYHCFQPLKNNPQNSSKFAIRNQSCFPKWTQSGISNNESPGFAELLPAGTKNLNYFRPDFRHLLPGCVWQGPGKITGWGNLHGMDWGGIAPASPQLECFTDAFPFGDISLDFWACLCFRKNSLQWFCPFSFADFPDGRSRRNECPDVLWVPLLLFSSIFPGCWCKVLVLGSLKAELCSADLQKYWLRTVLLVKCWVQDTAATLTLPA